MIYKAYDIYRDITFRMSLLSLNSAIRSIHQTTTATEIENACF